MDSNNISHAVKRAWRGSLVYVSMLHGEGDQRAFTNAHSSSHDQEDLEAVPDAQLVKLLRQYKDIFQEPRGVPLSREQNHHIPLLPGTG